MKKYKKNLVINSKVYSFAKSKKVSDSFQII